MAITRLPAPAFTAVARPAGVSFFSASFLSARCVRFLVVVADVLGHQPLQMPYVQNDDVIQQISSAISHPAFDDAVLPRASEVGLLGSDAEALYRADNLLVEGSRLDRRSDNSTLHRKEMLRAAVVA